MRSWFLARETLSKIKGNCCSDSADLTNEVGYFLLLIRLAPTGAANAWLGTSARLCLLTISLAIRPIGLRSPRGYDLRTR